MIYIAIMKEKPLSYFTNEVVVNTGSWHNLI